MDESGDPAFYGKKGRIIVGEPGCSRVFLLGFVETNDPDPIRRRLEKLRETVLNDPYLQPVPSVRKVQVSFHAKNDCPEVRMMVYKALADLEFSVQVVVARKIERMFRSRFQGNQDRFYDDLVSRLFENVLHRAKRNVITFERRGKRGRQHALREAIKAGTQRFRGKWGNQVSTENEIRTARPSEEPILQVIDYANWAVQRAYGTGEMRYFDFLREKFSLVVDIFDHEKYTQGRNIYTRARNPFDIKKVSTLG